MSFSMLLYRSEVCPHLLSLFALKHSNLYHSLRSSQGATLGTDTKASMITKTKYCKHF